MIWNIIGIYLLGIIVAYYSIRLIDGKPKTLLEVEINFKYSLMSWFVIVLALIIFPLMWLNKKLQEYFKDTKPPKWL